MLKDNQSSRQRPDLNKPLPLSPPGSSRSLSSISFDSRYSLTMSEDAASISDYLPSYNNKSTQFSDAASLTEPSSIHEEMNGEHQEFGLRTCYGSDALFRTMEHRQPADLGSEPVTANTRSSRPISNTRSFGATSNTATQTNTYTPNNDLISFRYADMAERPIMFYPQGRLIDLPKPKQRKMPTFKMFKRNRSDKHSEEIQSKTIDTQNPPPRPPRPPRHLCPSPPYNPDNMPGWKSDKIVCDVQGIYDRTGKKEEGSSWDSLLDQHSQPGLLTTDQGDSFVTCADLFRKLDQDSRTDRSMQYETRPDDSSKQKRIPSISRTLKHSASTYLQLLKETRENPRYFSEVPSILRQSTCGHEPTYSPRTRTRKHTVDELDHVPEDASLDSFSKTPPTNVQVKKRWSHRIGSSPVSHRYSPSNKSTPSHAFDENFSTNQSALLNPEVVAYQRERERVEAVSRRFREQYRTAWDHEYGEQLKNAGNIIASYAAESAQPTRTYTPKTDAQERDVNSNVEQVLPYDAIRIDPDNPRLSVTMARLAQLCAEFPPPADPNMNDLTTHRSSDIDRTSSYDVDLSSLVPAPLQTPDSTHRARSVPRYDLVAEDNFVVTPEAAQPLSQRTSSEPSSRFVDRIFTSSTFPGSYPSPISEPVEVLDGTKTRTPSPLLPPPPPRFFF